MESHVGKIGWHGIASSSILQAPVVIPVQTEWEQGKEKIQQGPNRTPIFENSPIYLNPGLCLKLWDMAAIVWGVTVALFANTWKRMGL
jgi:hypothetical protein